MQNLKYEARLEAHGLTSLEERRIRNDLITCYKYLNNMREIGNLDSLCVSGITQTRGHLMKLTRSHTRTVVRECCKGDDASQWENGKFDPLPHPNPLNDRHKKLHS